MKLKMTSRRRWLTSRLSIFLLGTGLVAGLIVLLPVFSYGVNETRPPQLPAGSTQVSRGVVNLIVEQEGELESSQNTVYASNCEWRALLLWIAPEGTSVQPGDVLVELDVSALRIRKEEREVRVLRARANLEQAEAKYQIQKLLNDSSTRAAELQALLADMDLAGYASAQYPMERMGVEQTITAAQENLAYLQKRVEYLSDLVRRGYKDQQTLESERIKLITAKQQLEQSTEKLRVLAEHTRNRKLVQLTAGDREAQRELERVGTAGNAALLGCEAVLQACRRQLELQLLRLNRVNRSIEACTIRAKQAGEVVHARNNGSQLGPQPGDEIFHLQQLVKLPDRTRMQVSLRLHESRVRAVTLGLPAMIKVDSLPGRRLSGRVTRVSTIPLQGRWPNVDRREYEVTVRLDNGQPGLEDALAPGMTADVRIMAAQRQDVIKVPMSAAVSIAGEDYVFIRAGDGVEHRRVEVGLVSDEAVEVKNGLEEGEVVVVTPLVQCSALVDELRNSIYSSRQATRWTPDDAG